MTNQGMWGGNLGFLWDKKWDQAHRHCQRTLRRRFTPKALRALCLRFLAREGIFPKTVIPAVVELVPVAIGRGGYPSSKLQDSKGVENDENGCLSFLGLGGLGNRAVLQDFLKGRDDLFDRLGLYMLHGLCRG